MHDEWNSFVARARNATFLFDRRYMDYHADRFTDHSIVFRRKGHLAALLPLNIDGDTVWSHQGLTYGGLLIDNKPAWKMSCRCLHLQTTCFGRVAFAE